MEVHPLERMAPTSAVSRHFAPLVSALGSARFEPLFFGLARELTRCEHVTVFAHGGTAIPRVLLAANSGPTPVARAVARKYVDNYWRHDPARRITKLADAGICMRVGNAEIDDDDYRRDCYTSVGLGSRISFLKRQTAELLQLNFYRAAPWQGLRSGDIDLGAHVETLLALVLKHNALDATAAAGRHEDLLRNRLRTAAPALTDRELDVCTAIFNGMTSEAIALDLGISINTVLTYRKRAYVRLGISSQNELMRIALDRLN
jgi:DNA-binding CsgD family transcriptional regulator